MKNVHRKKLEWINTKGSKCVDNSPPITLDLAKSRVASFKNFRSQELNDIYRRNQVLLEALNEISNRKVSDRQFKSQTHFVGSVKSLNYNFRSRVCEKIVQENEQILEKLSTKGATLSMKKLDEEYKLSLQYKKNLTRRQFYESPKRNLKKKKLPKLEKKPKDPKKLKTSQSESNLNQKTSEDLKKPENTKDSSETPQNGVNNLSKTFPKTERKSPNPLEETRENPAKPLPTDETPQKTEVSNPDFFITNSEVTA